MSNQPTPAKSASQSQAGSNAGLANLADITSPTPRTARDVLAAIIHRKTDMAIDTRLATQFDPLDDVLMGGFAPQDLILLGGKPGVGKTIAMLQWARNIAAGGNRVVFASYELSERNLLSRLLTAEVGQQNKHLDTVERGNIARIIRDSVRSGSISADPQVRQVIRQAYDSIAGYADNLLLQRVSGFHTDPNALAGLAKDWVGAGGALFVDYLQKVPVHGAKDDSERVLKVAESLKETAMASDVAIVAAAAVNASGLGQRRLRLEHMRGSALLAHECDLAFAMNEKHTALSKTHLAYDPHLYEESKSKIIFTIEKNREGPANIHLEFNKQFEDYRFDPNGGFVPQSLQDDIFEDS